MLEERVGMTREKKKYEAPQIRDLEDLGIRGEFPLGVDTCSYGTGEKGHQCTYGSGTRKNDPCVFGD
jgi:hypothetical protein